MEDINYRSALGILIKSMLSGYDENKVVNHEVLLVLGPTPQKLLDVGLPLLPLCIDGRVVDKAFFDHGIPRSMLERVYGLLDNPKAIYTAHQGAPGSVVVTYEMRDGMPIIIPIHPNKQKQRRNFYNAVASIYPKASNNGAQIGDRWKKEGLLLWEAT